MLANCTVESSKTKNLKSRLLVYQKNFLKSIEVKDIAYFFFEDKVTYVVTNQCEKYLIGSSLSQIEETLDESMFFRPNRMFIVSYHCINKIEPYLGNRLIIILKHELKVKTIVSREKVAEFKDWLDK